MDTLETYRSIYEASYKRQRASRTQWYFERFLRSADDVRVSDDGLAGMMARTYPFLFWDTELPLLNISRATTRPGDRGRGLMSALIRRVMVEEAARGVAFAAVNPPSRRLYFFFDRFGFATVGYVAEERYTDIHVFATPDSVEGREPAAATLRDIARARGMSVLLSDTDFSLLCEQLRLDDGSVISASDPSGAAMLFAGRCPEDGTEPVTVHGLYSTSPEASEAVLAALKADCAPRSSVTVRTDAEGAPRARLRSATMLRILDAARVLGALAAARPELRLRIRLRDAIIPSNNALFLINRGLVERVDDSSRRPDLDVSVETLCSILFSEPRIGDVFDIPSRRLAPIVLPG